LSHAEALEHLRANRPQAALALLESLLHRQPTDARGWFLLGACHHALNDLPGAAEAFSRSLLVDPANAETHVAYVSVLRAAGDKHGALAASRKALQQLPSDARLLYAIALCFEDLGKDDQALAHYDTALGIAPAFEDALHNRGLLLTRAGRFEEAEANQRRYVAAHPGAARAHSGLADTLLALGRFTQALEVLDTLDRLRPQDASARIRRGVALASLRRFVEAKEVIAAARAGDAPAVSAYLERLAPGSDAESMLCAENIYLWHGWKALGKCDWSRWDEYVGEMRRVAREPGIPVEPAVAFMCRLLPLSGAERRDVAGNVAQAIETRFPPLPPPAPRQRPRIRIGVLSPDFREHLNAHLLLPLFELLDRTRFELHAYSIAAEDSSPIRHRLRQSADSFRDLHDMTDRDAALVIRNDDIDILVDVGGYTTGARFAITAQRPARLQVNYLGFSSSLGSRRVDYAIVDRIVGIDDAAWTEARVFLPDTHFLYDFRAPAVAASPTRKDYGLPDNAFVFCAFHNAEKISPDVFNLWMQILAKAPQSILWFRALSETAIRNLRAQAAGRGIDPARLAFAPFEPSYDPRYLARHRLGDLMLDALHHNAMTSACDALGAGLPLLSVQGAAMASRAGESLLRAAGLPELVAQDQADYVQMAVRLATHPEALRVLRERLTANRRSAPIFDTAKRVRALEAAFLGMVERVKRGEPPASFDV
jgi:predicted O-linked N-acetylglucosamine transferase (SPINDLY family)